MCGSRRGKPAAGGLAKVLGMAEGKVPWRVVYGYEAGGQRQTGNVLFWTRERPGLEPGDSVVALRDPKRPSRSVLWTQVDSHAGPGGADVATAVRVDVARAVSADDAQGQPASDVEARSRAATS